MRRYALLASMLVAASVCHGSDIYPAIATNAWSLAHLASITQRLVASGTSLPAVASGAAGDLFILRPPGTWFRHDGSAWATMTIELASGTARPGAVGTGTQTFGGDKTFLGAVRSEAGFVASAGVSGLASSDIALPYQWGVSTWTLRVRGGLVVGVDTP